LPGLERGHGLHGQPGGYSPQAGREAMGRVIGVPQAQHRPGQRLARGKACNGEASAGGVATPG